ncbi:MAG: ATP-binding cassette domain-containing protein [Clostridiaceae bacterium]|nr:ATP-binding cassette domain-containing protein [Clostridiaceae bacterium]
MITFKHITKSFDEIDALKDINLEIHDNDFFGIIGMSGAGKSTLIRLINGLISPDDGEVLIDGKSISELSHKELNTLRNQIGMIFQHFNLLNQRTVLDNVALPLKINKISKAEREEKATQMLQLVGLSDKLKAYPAQLSGGQKQRVAIARALVNENKLLLCDEVTSALDPISTQSVLDLLKNLQKKLNLTIVMITHEMEVIEKVCNKVAILDNGFLVEKGLVSDIFTYPKHPTTKKLLGINYFPDGEDKDQQNSEANSQYKYHLRLAFDGMKTNEPILAELVLRTGQKFNILQADTRLINDKSYGQMLIGLDKIDDSIFEYFAEKNIAVSLENISKGGA